MKLHAFRQNLTGEICQIIKKKRNTKLTLKVQLKCQVVVSSSGESFLESTYCAVFKHDKHERFQITNIIFPLPTAPLLAQVFYQAGVGTKNQTTA